MYIRLYIFVYNLKLYIMKLNYNDTKRILHYLGISYKKGSDKDMDETFRKVLSIHSENVDNLLK